LILSSKISLFSPLLLRRAEIIARSPPIA
jgi:hypothetical protein